MLSLCLSLIDELLQNLGYQNSVFSIAYLLVHLKRKKKKKKGTKIGGPVDP